MTESRERLHRDTTYDKPYRELEQDDKDEIYNRFNSGDIIMVNYPEHEYHKRIGRSKHMGV